MSGYIPKFPVLLRKYLPYIAVIGIAFGGIAQLLHYNPYADRILKVSELIKADAQSSGKCCIVAQDSLRLHYYSDLPTFPVISHHTREYSYWQKVSKTLQNGFEDEPDTVYIVVPEFAKDSPLLYRDGVPEVIRRETVLLKEFYHSRKKKRVTRVYRCNWKNVRVQSLQPYLNVTSTKPVHTIIFRETIDENSQTFRNEMMFFSERRDKYQAPKVNGLPGWWRLAWCPGFELGSNGEVGLESLSDKKKVFRLKSDKLISSYYGQLFPAKKWRVKVKVSGQSGSKFSIGSFAYDSRQRWGDVRPQLAMNLPSDGIWEYSVDMHWMSEKEAYFRLVIYLYHGEIFIHSIELYEVDEKK